MFKRTIVTLQVLLCCHAHAYRVDVMRVLLHSQVGRTACLLFTVVTAKGDRTGMYGNLQVNSNYGHPAYTCLYRIRVHGRRPDADGEGPE